MKPRTKCPVCKSGIPVWIHISFNHNTGLECTECRSILTHSKISLAFKWIMLLTFVISFSRLVDGFVTFVWIGTCLVSLCLLFYIQLTNDFIVVYNNKKIASRASVGSEK